MAVVLGVCFSFQTRTQKTLAFVSAPIVTTTPPDGGGAGGSTEEDDAGASLVMGSIPSVRSSADASVETDKFFLCVFAALVTTPFTSCSINRAIHGVTVASTGRCGDIYVGREGGMPRI